MPRMWKHIKIYERATAMRANKLKFEGFRLGRTLREQVPEAWYTQGIKFVESGEYIKILGIPFGEDFDERDFIERKQPALPLS